MLEAWKSASLLLLGRLRHLFIAIGLARLGRGSHLSQHDETRDRSFPQMDPHQRQHETLDQQKCTKPTERAVAECSFLVRRFQCQHSREIVQCVVRGCRFSVRKKCKVSLGRVLVLQSNTNFFFGTADLRCLFLKQHKTDNPKIAFTVFVQWKNCPEWHPLVDLVLCPNPMSYFAFFCPPLLSCVHLNAILL